MSSLTNIFLCGITSIWGEVLLEDTGLRDEYGTVKRKLASKELADVDEYCRGKNEVMLKILRKAGWSD